VVALGALVVGAVVGAGVAVVALRHNGPKNLDQGSVTAGVQSVLTGSYGLSTASAVSCPHGMTTKPGNVYTCNFTVGSAAHSVKITIQNDAGQYLVGSPT
jgi:Domain of unknown function (DUF4333)